MGSQAHLEPPRRRGENVMAEYIKRDDVIQAIEGYSLSNGSALGYHSGAVDCAIQNIENMPAADVAEVRHARWEECDYVEPCVHGFGTIRHTNAGLKCSNCVNVFMKNLLWKENYCPNCGAKMDLKEES